MFGSGISIGGLSSGLDSNSIITQLVSLERIPIQLLETQKGEQEAKLSAVGSFKGLVTELQTKAKTLSTLEGFLDFTVSPGVEGIASFSASGAASAGNHTLEVQQLAATDRWAFDGVAALDTDLGTANGQTVSFDAGGTSYSFTFDQADSTLEEIAAAINEGAAGDASASIVNVGTSANPSHQLVLTSDSSGEDFRITNISSTVAGLNIDGTAPVGGVAQSANNISVGTNAVAVIDGLAVERETNDFNDVVPGISLTVQSENIGSPINFSVEANVEAVKEKLTGFVDAYNAVMGFINDQNDYSEDDGPGGELFGDQLLSAARNTINSALFNVDLATVTGDSAGFTTLGIIGIETQSDGSLSMDDLKIDEKIAENLDALADLFVDSDGFDNGGAEINTPEYYEDTTADSGIAASLVRSIDRMIKTSETSDGSVLKGLFDARSEAINSNISRFNDQIESREFYLEQFEASLVEKYANLEDVMAGLNAQGAALQAALTGLI